MPAAQPQAQHLDRAAHGAPSGAEWQWRHGATASPHTKQPVRRVKGPPPVAALASDQHARRKALADVQRASHRSRAAQTTKLAPHLAKLLNATPAETAGVVQASKRFAEVARHAQALLVRERGAFAALVLPMVLLAGALLINTVFAPRLADSSFGATLVAWDRQVMEPGPAVRALAVARDRATEQSIIARLPEFPVVSALPALPALGRLDVPSLRLAAIAPQIEAVTPVPAAPDLLRLPEIVLKAEAPAIVPLRPSEPVLAAPANAVGDAAVAVPLPQTADAAQCVRAPDASGAESARHAASAVLASGAADDATVFGRALAAAAQMQVKELSIYNAKYVRIAYPRGDVTTQFGVCSDVIIRAYRALNIDLQELVHLSRAGAADSNIDHRRTELLRAFFAQHGASLPVSPHVEDYLPGDIVTYYRPQNKSSTAHIAIVSDQIAPSGRPMIVHNRGWGVQVEDALFVDQMTGHYRFQGLSTAAVAALPKSSRLAAAAQRLRGRVAEATARDVAATAGPVSSDPGPSGVTAQFGQRTGRVPRPQSARLTGLPPPMALGVRSAPGSLR